MAAVQLQIHLQEQRVWEHNFGLRNGQEGPVIGKMFGVLVVQAEQGELGFLAAFSGKLAGSNHHAYFVPPVFDSLTEGSFLNLGMAALTQLNNQIKALSTETPTVGNQVLQAELMAQRKLHSLALQEQLFEEYHFLNQGGEVKTLRQLFKKESGKNPPAGAGECAGPKLLQYAFQHKLQPLAMAEFWWGQSPKSVHWQHGHFYPACQEKCAPILAHMLQGLID
ncbi:pseudouridylate synthase [Nibribacter ruber]|nr:pseudouridylate synthase [Nibribacter ruber]